MILVRGRARQPAGERRDLAASRAVMRPICPGAGGDARVMADREPQVPVGARPSIVLERVTGGEQGVELGEAAGRW